MRDRFSLTRLCSNHQVLFELMEPEDTGSRQGRMSGSRD